MSAPHFAGLEWSRTDTGWTTEGTSAFWDYYNVARSGFKTLDFCVSKPANKWIVTAPDIDDRNRDRFRELIAGISEQLNARADRNRAALAAQEARDDALRTRRAEEARVVRARTQAQILEARSLRNSKVVADARAAGAACLATWGTLVHRKSTLAELLAMPLLNSTQIRLVHTLVAETDRKAAALARKASGVRDDACVQWADDVVEKAVRFLTARDADHAVLANGQGWSPTHTGAGHWCVATLDTDRAAALRLARTLIGHYRHQLSSILSSAEMPSTPLEGAL